jgi:hypothetical protein
MTFMTIYTPTYKRPMMLRLCQASVNAQTCKDFEHVIFQDERGHGIPGMYKQLKQSAPGFIGQYVYILQDDDRLFDNRVIDDIKTFVETENYPPVVVMRSRKGRLHLPRYWGEEPVHSCIDLGNYVIRRDIFMTFADCFGEKYDGDYDFIHCLWRHGLRFEWYDRQICESDQFGKGAPE